MSEETKQFYAFGPFRMDSGNRVLVHKGKPIPLTPKAAETLLLLVKNAGHLVSKEDLLARVWPDAFVEEGNLNKNIFFLRKALGERDASRPYIETVPRRGYRFLVPVTEVTHAESAPHLYPFPRTELIGKKLLHYRMLEVVGGGGMGMVYKAEDLKLGRQVALKFLPEELASDPVAMRRFEREARTASSLNHPNICTIYGIEEFEGQPFLAMELLEGETLRDRLAAAKSTGVPFDQLLDIALQACVGLEAAHKSGIIHRDIKPANIFLTGQGQVKIVDFGLAKSVTNLSGSAPGDVEGTTLSSESENGLANDNTITRVGVAMGTAGYMSPEQIRGETLDARTDLFSFGLVLYEMATGKRAFAGETAGLQHKAILNDTPVPLREINAALPPKFEHIIETALAKDRAKRYQHASDIATDLKELGKPASEERTSLAWRFVLPIVLVLLVGFGAMTWRRSRPQPEPIPDLKLTQLTANSSDNYVGEAKISPDGKYLLYTDLKGMHLKHLETGQIEEVPRPAGVSRLAWGTGPWFPDSTRVLLNRRGEGGQPSSIWTMSIPPDEPHKIREDCTVWSISPDGNTVAFTANRGRLGDREIWLMDPGGEHPQMIYKTDEQSSVARIEWFADSRRILYGRESSSFKEPRHNVESRTVTGGSPTTVLSLNSGAPDHEIADGYLLQDGRFIYALGEQGMNGPSCNFWEMQLDAHTGEARGKPRRLTNWSGVCIDSMSATDDGKRVIFTKWWPERSVYVANFESNGMRLSLATRLTLSDADELPVAWTPDSKAVIFESNLNGTLGIFRQPLDKDIAEPIVASIAGSMVSLGEEERASGRVSPDGMWLLYPVFLKDRPSPTIADLMRVPISGGSPKLLFRTTLYDAPHCSKLPTNFCVFARVAPEGDRLIFTTFDPVLGQGKEVATFMMGRNPGYNGSGSDVSSNAFVWDLSPDGAHIAVLKRREAQFQLLSTVGGAARALKVKGGKSVGSLNWAPDGKSLIASSWREGKSVLLRIDLEGNSRVMWEQNGSLGARAVPSPDGRHLAIGAFRLNNNVWMMEDFQATVSQ